MRFSQLERESRDRPLILKLSKGGQPIKWTHWHDACIAHWNGKVTWGLGEELEIRGGTGRDGNESIFRLPTIIACDDGKTLPRRAPTLTNAALYKRDGGICGYCGKKLSHADATRDHIIPTSRGGKNVWTNVILCCKHHNHVKADRLPEEAGLQLIMVPYQPSLAAHLILQNRRILADQMQFLLSHVGDQEKKRLGFV